MTWCISIHTVDSTEMDCTKREPALHLGIGGAGRMATKCECFLLMSSFCSVSGAHLIPAHHLEVHSCPCSSVRHGLCNDNVPMLSQASRYATR